MSPSAPISSQPGVLVLGMHRSGTSVVAGLADAFGLYGGPRETMISADQFNSDGYWEQRPLVEFHDAILGRLGGYASAPPTLARIASEPVVSAAFPIVAGLLARLDKPWFLKDPRQCLLLHAWTNLVHPDTLHVVVSRDPEQVIRSLRHRNGYSQQLAAGVWARYNTTLLRDLRHKPCYFVQYEDLLAAPRETTAKLIGALAERFPAIGRLDDEATDRAASLIRPPSTASSVAQVNERASLFAPAVLDAEYRTLYEVMKRLNGPVERFECPTLPSLSPLGERAIRKRRRKLHLSKLGPRMGSMQRAKLDQRQRGR